MCGVISYPVFPLALLGAIAGLFLLWFTLDQFIEWVQAPPDAPPGHEGDVPVKEETRPGAMVHVAAVFSCALVVYGLASAAVTGPWPARTFNAVVRPTGLLADVVGVFFLAGSVERTAMFGEGSVVLWDKDVWETPGLFIIAAGFLLQAATAFEAFQVAC